MTIICRTSATIVAGGSCGVAGFTSSGRSLTLALSGDLVPISWGLLAQGAGYKLRASRYERVAWRPPGQRMKTHFVIVASGLALRAKQEKEVKIPLRNFLRRGIAK